MPEWVKVSERLPWDGAQLWLAWAQPSTVPEVRPGAYRYDRFWCYTGAAAHRMFGVTHWMPVDVPEPPPNHSETPNTISGGRSTERMPASRWENAEENRATPELRELIEATNERFRQARASACSVDRRVWQAVYTAWREAVPFSEPSAGEAADRELRTLLRGEAP